MTRSPLLLAAVLLGAPFTVSAQPAPSPATAQNGGALVSDADLHRQIAIMKAQVGSDTALLVRPVIRVDGTTAALELWRKPRPPAVHVAEAEYVRVMEGRGWMLSGGTLTNAREAIPGLVVGDEIEGGTRREIKPGDVFLIPAGMPHWFGIHGGSLVLLGIKISAVAPKK